MISLRDLMRTWNNFFFKPESPLPIAVYRILLGLLLLANQALLWPEVLVWFGNEGSLSPESAGRISGGQGFSLFKHLPQSDGTVWLIFGLSLVFALLLTAGLFTRLSAISMFLCLVSLQHRNALVLNSGDSFLRIATFFVIFSHAGAALSVDRLIRLRNGKESGPPKPCAPWAMRLIQLQLAFLYLYAFVWKAMGPMWLNGTALYYTSRLMEFRRFPLPYIFEHIWTIKLWTWGSLFLEFALGVLIWIKELRYWVLLGGVLLHAGIDYTMNIPLFGPIMIAAYVTFIEPKDLEKAIGWLKLRFSKQKPATPGPVKPVTVGQKANV